MELLLLMACWFWGGSFVSFLVVFDGFFFGHWCGCFCWKAMAFCIWGGCNGAAGSSWFLFQKMFDVSVNLSIVFPVCMILFLFLFLWKRWFFRQWSWWWCWIGDFVIKDSIFFEFCDGLYLNLFFWFLRSGIGPGVGFELGWTQWDWILLLSTLLTIVWRGWIFGYHCWWSVFRIKSFVFWVISGPQSIRRTVC